MRVDPWRCNALTLNRAQGRFGRFRHKQSTRNHLLGLLVEKGLQFLEKYFEKNQTSSKHFFCEKHKNGTPQIRNLDMFFHEAKVSPKTFTNFNMFGGRCRPSFCKRLGRRDVRLGPSSRKRLEDNIFFVCFFFLMALFLWFPMFLDNFYTLALLFEAFCLE